MNQFALIAALFITPTLLAQVPVGVVGLPFGYTLGFGGDQLFVSYRFQGGTLPPGVSFVNTPFGDVAGVPQQAGVFTFSVQGCNVFFGAPDCGPVGPVTITVRNPCATIPSQEALVPLTGGTGQIHVTAPANCFWALSPGANESPYAFMPVLPFWIQLAADRTTGVVTYTVAPSNQPRSATIVVGDSQFTFVQEDTPSHGLQFYPLPPCRVADTRNAAGPLGGPSVSGGPRSFPIASSACGIPPNVELYSLNVTAWPRGRMNYLTLWATGKPQPFVSTLNGVAGRLVANAAIVPAGTNGEISAFASGDTDLIIDINGYFAPPAVGGLSFFPIPPCRVADTRNPAGPFGGPVLGAVSTRTFSIPTSACGVPSSASAYSLNATVVPIEQLGFLTLWPSGSSLPLVSTLNSLDGNTVANAAIVAAGDGGGVSAFVTHATHLILDMNGYFAPQAPGGLLFYPVAPCRVIDTRNTDSSNILFGSPALSAGGVRPVAVAESQCGVPATARAYALNATVVPAGPLGYLTLWPAGQTQPFVSTLNSLLGFIDANQALVPADANGNIAAFTTDATDLVLDITGYFAPPVVLTLGDGCPLGGDCTQPSTASRTATGR